MHKRTFWLFLLICFGGGMVSAQIEVPANLTYCGVEVELTTEAQKIIEDYVRKIYESPRYFNEMVKRAHLYMPFIEEAFANIGVPDDLKYLAIQESALRSDVISPSQAVGFWQFKEATAQMYGLRVNDKVDERKHIFRASEAAAIYLAEANQDFDNWLYAVMAYYEGLTGAVAHTDPQYYSNPHMTVTESMHWYVLKAIAHKVAYEKSIRMRSRPIICLQPYSTNGEVSIGRLLDLHKVNEEEFFEYNKWISTHKRLPKNELFTYYVPLPGEFYAGHIEDPNKVIGGGLPEYDPSNFQTEIASEASFQSQQEEPEYQVQIESEPIIEYESEPFQDQETEFSSNSNEIQDAVVMEPEMPQDPPIEDNQIEDFPFEENSTEQPASYNETVNEQTFESEPIGYNLPEAIATENLNQFDYVEFGIEDDLHYGLQFVRYSGKKPIVEIANNYEKRLTDLLVWNGLLPGEEPEVGKLIYLDKPSRLEYHIVQEGENIYEIASIRFTTPEKIQRFNDMPAHDMQLYIGQKLYLRKKRPRGEKMIVLTERVEEVESTPIVSLNENTESDPPIVNERPAEPSEAPTADNPIVRDEPAVERPFTQPPSQPQQGTQTLKKRWVHHVVQPGETLWSISKLYNTKVAIIKQINKLSSDDITEGQSLKILAAMGQ